MSQSTLLLRAESRSHPTRWFLRPQDTGDDSGLLYIEGLLWSWTWLHGECNNIPALAGALLESPGGERVQCSFVGDRIFCERFDYLPVFQQALAQLNE